ncbi:nuclear transport factor 2 family protein [Oleiharenicola lentus]|uniref:nuclear transport factor 2 family protein n=1 Tax=Oleiharenicola lentus TaxID=2508720 RepID=UPI003F67E88B
MKFFCALLFATSLFAAKAVAAPTHAVAIEEKITAALVDFLTYNSDPARHENFWAEDLIYTSSLAAVRTKPMIMQSVTEAAKLAKVALTKKAPTAYSATDIKVRVYEGFAALTFQLVARSADGTEENFRNSGTFVLRGECWQAVTWQATRIPTATADSK